ncbi:MAG TPA: isocitrate lyase/phosphoenolpyruvate mutase family protein [Ktedonobacteraceae bacterium]
MRKTEVLRAALSQPGLIRVLGVYDGISALLGERHHFHALWASGLSISAAHGMPDASVLTMTEFWAASHLINRVSRLPVIADCDTGFGAIHNVIRMVREYEQSGIAAICIEDKEFPKRNSFVNGHRLADVDEFCAKIRAAKGTQSDPDFMVIARLESLIAGTGHDDALTRGGKYVEAGADAILVHSKATTPDEIWEFARHWHDEGQATPLIVLPTTYPSVTCRELETAGIRMVIYANHTVRAAIRAMDASLALLWAAESSEPIESTLASVGEVLALVGTDTVPLTEAQYQTEPHRDAAGHVASQDAHALHPRS